MHPEMGEFSILAFVARQPEQVVYTDLKLTVRLCVLFTLGSLPHDELPCSEQLMFTTDGHDRLFLKKKMALGIRGTRIDPVQCQNGTKI